MLAVGWSSLQAVGGGCEWVAVYTKHSHTLFNIALNSVHRMNSHLIFMFVCFFFK